MRSQSLFNINSDALFRLATSDTSLAQPLQEAIGVIEDTLDAYGYATLASGSMNRSAHSILTAKTMYH
jgi:hypothetical protein